MHRARPVGSGDSKGTTTKNDENLASELEDRRVDDDIVNEDLDRSMLVLLNEGKYGLAAVTTVLSALAFVIALAVRAMTTSCIHYMLGENDRKECIMGVLEAFMSLGIVLLVAIVLLNMYLWGRRTIMLSRSRLSDML